MEWCLQVYWCHLFIYLFDNISYYYPCTFGLCLGGRLYSATVADFSSRDPLIYSSPLRTEQHDSQWLNGMPNWLLYCFPVSVVCLSVCLSNVCKHNFCKGIVRLRWNLWCFWCYGLVVSSEMLKESVSVMSSVFCADPNFVSSFHLDGMVYFFFRETAVENINCGKVSNRCSHVWTRTNLLCLHTVCL